MNKYKEIGDRIKHLRGPDTTQADFSRKLNMTLRSYQRYESGERMPKGDVLAKIASLRNVPVDYLLHGRPRVFTIEEARERMKFILWLEGITKFKEEELEYLAKSILKYDLSRPDEITNKITALLQDLSLEQKAETLRFIEGQKLLADRDKKLKKG